ncbi:L,D-transpeptidase [Varibaculum cambriense]|nr:L,D-transpeptidase [Varibaculum cambriense]
MLFNRAILEAQIPMSKKAKITIAVIVTALVALVAAFAIYVTYYAIGKKALPGTTVGEVKVSGMTSSQIQKQLEAAQTDYKATFSGQGIAEKSFTPQEIGYRLDAKATAKNATERNSAFSYVSSLFSSRQVDIVHDIDPAVTNKLSQDLSKDIPGSKPATEPVVKANAEGTGFEVVPGKDGFGADTQTLIAAANKVMETQQDQNSSIKVSPVKPLASQDIAQQMANAAAKLTENKVTITAGEKTFTADQKAKVSFVKIPTISKTAKPEANQQAVGDWVNKNKEAVEVKKVDGKRYVNSAGKVLKTETEPKDGVTVSNGKELTQEISKNFAAGKDSAVSYETQVEKASIKDKTIADGAENLAYMAAPGEKWIDINLSNYSVTGYEGATVVKGSVAMVPGAPATPTIKGNFAIERKYRSKTMRGSNADGSRYVSPNVPYAMFFSGGYALHGAPWRGSFGWGGPEVRMVA